MKTHPHETKSFQELMVRLYRLAWYAGKHDLCNITIEGGFEHNLSSRATDAWDLVFVVKTKEVTSAEGKVILPALEAKSEVFDDACKEILSRL